MANQIPELKTTEELLTGLRAAIGGPLASEANVRALTELERRMSPSARYAVAEKCDAAAPPLSASACTREMLLERVRTGLLQSANENDQAMAKTALRELITRYHTPAATPAPCARAWTHWYPNPPPEWMEARRAWALSFGTAYHSGLEALIKQAQEREEQKLRERYATRAELEDRSTKALFALVREGIPKIGFGHRRAALDVLEARANDRIAERVTQLEEGLKEVQALPRAESCAEAVTNFRTALEALCKRHEVELEIGRVEPTPGSWGVDEYDQTTFNVMCDYNIAEDGKMPVASMAKLAEINGYTLLAFEETTREARITALRARAAQYGMNLIDPMEKQRDTLAALKNMGHDVTCGACMQRAFTGEARFVMHTCGGKGPYCAPLQGGEPAQLPTVGERCVASWQKINPWLAAVKGRIAIVSGSDDSYRVSLHDAAGKGYDSSCSGVPGHRIATPPRSRPDALAHAAQWCETKGGK